MVIMTSSHNIYAQTSSEPGKGESPPTESNSNQIRDDANLLLTRINMTESPWDVAVNPKTNIIYVSHSGSPTISVIDSTTNDVVKSIPVIRGSGEIAVNSETNMVYVSTDSFNGAVVHVIDGKTNDIVSNIAIESGTTDIAVNPVTNMVYLTHVRNMTSIIDGDTNFVHTITVHNYPWKVAVNPVTNMVYIATVDSNEISVIDGSDNRAVRNITVAGKVYDVGINSNTNTVYAANNAGNRISVINGTTKAIVKTITSNFTDYGEAKLVVDNATNLVYVVSSSDTISVIDGETNSIVGKLMLDGRDPVDLAINPQTNMIYAPSLTDDTVSIINGKRNAILTYAASSNQQRLLQAEVPGIKVGRNPIDIAVNPETNMIYVIYSTSNIVSVIDGDTNSIIGFISVGTPPSAIDVNPFTNTIYLINREFNSVITIDGATNVVSSNITLSGTPRDLAVNPETNMIYTHNGGGLFDPNESISAIDPNANSEIDNLSLDYASSLAIDTNTNTLYLPSTVDNSITTIVGLFPNLKRDLGLNLSFSIINEISGDRLSELSGINDVAVNPTTNFLYVTDIFGETVSEIDSYTGDVIRNFTIPGDPTDIAVNPQTNMVYITNRFSDALSIINLTSNIVENIPVGHHPSALAINPETNMIYVTNTDSSTISIINGHKSRTVAGVNFNVNPSNAGLIECNGQKISANYSLFDSGADIKCKAIGNSGFQFTSWSGDFVPSSLDKSSEAPVMFLDNLFGSWFNSNNNENVEGAFSVSKYGAITANFINPVEITIPWELLAGIILGPIVGWSIPSLVGWFKSKRDSGKLNYYHKQIGSLYGDGKLDVNDLETLNQLTRNVADAYSKGKINEKHYESLRNEISVLYERIFRKKIDDLLSNNSPIKKTTDEDLDELKNELGFAYSEGKINEKHYVLLSEAILDQKIKDK
jgi:YVTN family beta-propeller protein